MKVGHDVIAHFSRSAKKSDTKTRSMVAKKGLPKGSQVNRFNWHLKSAFEIEISLKSLGRFNKMTKKPWKNR